MTGLSACRYRLAQLGWSVRARVSPEDRAWVDLLLSPAERELFHRMPLFDQAHALEVARDLDAEGADPALLRAALLHDCGKTLPPRSVPLPYRGLVVLLRAVSPRLLRALARRWGPLWPIYLHVHHAEIGAQELERLGADPRVVEIVRAHQRPSGDPDVGRLQAADGSH